MSYDVQGLLSFAIGRTSYLHGNPSQVGPQSHTPNLPAGFYVQGGSPGLPSSPTSNVKVKRPDGTWATVLKVAEVHLRRADGTWEVFA